MPSPRDPWPFAATAIALVLGLTAQPHRYDTGTVSLRVMQLGAEARPAVTVPLPVAEGTTLEVALPAGP